MVKVWVLSYNLFGFGKFINSVKRAFQPRFQPLTDAPKWVESSY